MISADSLTTTSPKSNSMVSVDLVPISEVEHAIANTPNILGVISYDATDLRDISNLNIELAPLNQQPYMEVWQSDEPVTIDCQEGIYFSKNSQFLFGTIQFACDLDLQDQTTQIYNNLLRFLRQQEFSHLIRVWNQFPNINEMESSIERYQKFCIGRQSAFQSFYGNDFQQYLPAASAIGTHKTEFSLYFIASNTPGIYLENPRQTSAYDYPQQYGPCSPSFARATVYQNNGVSKLYISGTASIVGHETLHVGDVTKQLEETIGNIESILHHKKIQSSLPAEVHFSIVKVYLRDPAYKSIVEDRVQEYFGNSMNNILYLHGDICRSDLLLEIEGICDLN